MEHQNNNIYFFKLLIVPFLTKDIIILLFNSVFVVLWTSTFNIFYYWMINRFDYFGSWHKQWIQLSGSKSTQHGQMTDSAEIWSLNWEGQTSMIEWMAGWHLQPYLLQGIKVMGPFMSQKIVNMIFFTFAVPGNFSLPESQYVSSLWTVFGPIKTNPYLVHLKTFFLTKTCFSIHITSSSVNFT